METEQMAVFKSYLRELLGNLLEIKKALDDGDIERAKEKLNTVIENTQKGIED